MDRIRMIIATENESHLREAAEFFSTHKPFEVVAVTSSGREIPQLLSRLRPDILLMDLMLEEMDGLCVLRKLQMLTVSTSIVVCTHLVSEISQQAAMRLGADYFIGKPIRLQNLYDVLICCAKLQKANNSMQRAETTADAASDRLRMIKSQLTTLGFSPVLAGFSCLCEACNLYLDDPSYLANLSKTLYAAVGERLGLSAQNVERSIRTSIRSAYRVGRLAQYFPTCPSNKTFLNVLHAQFESIHRRAAGNPENAIEALIQRRSG